MILQQRPLITVSDILVTADNILWCTKNLFAIDFHFLFHRKKYNPCSYSPPLSHLTSCTPSKSNLYLANSVAAVVNEPALYRLLTFYVPNLISLFHCLGRTEGSVQARSTHLFPIKAIFYGEELLAPCPTPKLEEHLCRLSVTAFSIRSQLPSMLEAVPPSATRGRAMPW